MKAEPNYDVMIKISQDDRNKYEMLKSNHNISHRDIYKLGLTEWIGRVERKEI